MTRPNILFITADQMRWDCLGCAGNPVIQTPHLDALAAAGTRFTNAFTPDPICVPARASIMTGNYPQVCTGHKGNTGAIREGQPLLTRTLKSAGYRTYALGKLHFLPYAPPDQPRTTHGFDHVEWTESGRILKQYDPKGERRGVEDYFDHLHDQGWHGYARAHGIGNNDVRPCASPLPAELYVDAWIADRSIAALDRHCDEHADAPFFLWMSSPKPHSPYDPPPPFDRLHDPRTIPPPFGDLSLLEHMDPNIEQTLYSHGCDSLSPEAWQVIRSYYYGNISFLDAQVGRVLAHLDRLGLRENTLIIFTADHGDLLGDFGSAFKSNHMNGSVRVPFLAAGPGIPAGAVASAPMGLQDLHPTFADFAGADIGQPVHGLSLRSLLDGGPSQREWYYACTGHPGHQSSMIANGEWKYIYSEHGGIEQLYDQRNDPGEVRNLAGDPAHVFRTSEMRERLISEARKTADPLVETGALPRRDLDRAALRQFHVGHMGWRWY